MHRGYFYLLSGFDQLKRNDMFRLCIEKYTSEVDIERILLRGVVSVGRKSRVMAKTTRLGHCTVNTKEALLVWRH